MNGFENILKEARLLDRGESVAATDDITYFRRLLENTNKKVNSIRPFFYAFPPTTYAVAGPATIYESFAMLNDTTAYSVSTSGTPVVNTAVAYFGHLNIYIAPPVTGGAGTWNFNLELSTPRNNDPAGGTNIIPLIGFASSYNTYASDSYTANNIKAFNNWGAIDKFNTGDLDRILFHNFRLRLEAQVASSLTLSFHAIFKGYQADLS